MGCICTFRWYMKAHQLNPRNGKPYNQLAILAVYGVRIFPCHKVSFSKNCKFIKIGFYFREKNSRRCIII